ncbi:MAG: HvfC/BufC family peptide modification chaperone [Formosimonas sp.]
MTSLAEQQQALARRILQYEGSNAVGWAVYRNNLDVTWRNALSNTYPVVTQLLGEQGMALLARDYLRAHPSQSGDLNELGAALPDFVADYAPLAAYLYLPDVARLEWRVQQAYFAANHTPPQWAEVLRYGVQDWLQATVEWAPSAHLLQCATAAAEIWQAHQPAGDLSGLTSERVLRPQFVLLTRPHWRVEVQVLDAGAYAFLQQLRVGASFEQALEALAQQGVEFDLVAALPVLLASGVWGQIIWHESTRG